MTRLFVAIVAIVMCAGGKEASAKNPLAQATMQGVLTSSVQRAVTVSLVKPVTSPLLKWARAAADKARQERLDPQAHRQAPVADEADLSFSRDRD